MMDFGKLATYVLKGFVIMFVELLMGLCPLLFFLVSLVSLQMW